MNVFEIQRQLVADYRSYVESFITIRDQEIATFVKHEYANDKYWPEALVQLSPSFAIGASIPDLVADGTLHPDVDPLLRIRKSEGDAGRPLILHKHQLDAVHLASRQKSYVLTTGTGSGKSLAYFIPIIDRVIRNSYRPGLIAIVVYPMNALCNSQYEELERFLGPSDTSQVRYARYTGQEPEELRTAIRANPPHILLTNYVMLELMLTRSEDAPLLNKADNLEFLVLDELHTYRGRQGADVAMLVRRLRNRTGVTSLQCIGTSATMVSEGSWGDRQEAIATVATKLFGTKVVPESVIGETLVTMAPASKPPSDELAAHSRKVVSGQIPDTPAEFLRHPLAAWIERAFGITERDGRIERVDPITVSEGAAHLARYTGLKESDAAEAIRAMLLQGYRLTHPDSGRPIFAFRLHQFISRGNTVFATLDAPGARHLSLDGQTTVPGTDDRRLYPMAFCRACGEAYFSVEIIESSNGASLISRQFSDMSRKDDENRTTGYLWLESEWPHHADQAFAFQPERLPDQFLQERRGGLGTTNEIRKRIVPATARPNGDIALFDEDGPAQAWFVRGGLPFCLNCRETWGANTSEFTKLGSLASEGRAGATTILSLKLVQALRASEDLLPEARKLLSFTDNRQDAALQAGHFNDFITTSLLRSAILAAIPADGEQSFETLPNAVVAALNLRHEEFALPGVAEDFFGEGSAKKAFRQVIAWHVFRDLRRGWRVNQPNLEQLRLLQIDYRHLDALAAHPTVWDTLLDDLGALPRPMSRSAPRGENAWAWLDDPHLPGLVSEIASAGPELRRGLLHGVLNHFRIESAIQADILTQDGLEHMKSLSMNNLNDSWSFDRKDVLEPARALRVSSQQRKGPDRASDLTPTSRVGMLISDPARWGFAKGSKRRSTKDRLLILHILTRVLARTGLFYGPEPQLFLLKAEELAWKRFRGDYDADTVNAFFREYYLTLATALESGDGPASIRSLKAGEHTAQVDSELRQRREQEFRQGTLPVLYCSPTMELGVDIASLNAVNMRNVPPTPANYAQRSGRAGRAGQPAIVVTYCSANSPHDQYYFEHRRLMVSGAVAAPRIDLANRDLVASHMRAVWLAETGARPGSSVANMLDVTADTRELPLVGHLAATLQESGPRRRALIRCRQILDGLSGELEGAGWYRPEWIDTLLLQAPGDFDRACDHWRELFRSAERQREVQNARAQDMTITARERERAMSLRDEAERQRELLIADRSLSNRGSQGINHDFNPFRYLASEGFLPGYNFPRLPLTAYIPAQRAGSTADVMLQRPRFIAISEYGPGNTIYYEGNRYRVERVDIPTSRDGTGSVTESIKVCQVCGFAHLGETLNADVCRNPTCGVTLNGPFQSQSLLRLQNVRTRRHYLADQPWLEPAEGPAHPRLPAGHDPRGVEPQGGPLPSGFRNGQRPLQPGRRAGSALRPGPAERPYDYAHD